MASPLIRTRKTGTGVTTLSIATADDSKLTPPVGLQVHLVAIGVGSTANVTNITVSDGGNLLFTLLPSVTGAGIYQDFPEIPITTGTNDMRLTLTCTSGNPAVTVWYVYK